MSQYRRHVTRPMIDALREVASQVPVAELTETEVIEVLVVMCRARDRLERIGRAIPPIGPPSLTVVKN